MHEVLADKVVKMLLSGNNEFLQILRNQYENSMIKSIQVSGTRPLDTIKDYIIFDSIDTIVEVLTIKEPMLIKI